MGTRIAIQRAEWDVMHEKLVTPEFARWLETCAPGISATAVSDEEILDGALDRFDAVFYPGSVGSFLAVEKFGDRYRSIVRDFVHRGGRFIGVCGGCYAAVKSVPLWKPAVSAITGVFKNPGYLKDTIRDVTRSDPEIRGGARRAMGMELLAMAARGRLRTFGLVDAVAYAPMFVANPVFIQNQWAKMITAGRLLRVNIKVQDEPSEYTRGHEGESLACAYSGGAIIDEPGHRVQVLARYDYCKAVPDAFGKVAVATCRFGDGTVVVSGPDFYLPFETLPGVRIVKGMEPSVAWLTERALLGATRVGKPGAKVGA